MVVHIFIGRGSGCSAAPPNIDRQQRGTDTVPQQLLREVAQQFADSRWVLYCGRQCIREALT